MLLAVPITAQRYTVSGYITDIESGERLIGASVYDTISRQGVVTNVAGFYTLTLPEGEHALQISYVGYHPSYARAFLLDKDTVIHFPLRPSTRLEEVTVVGHQSINSPQSAQMSAIEVPISQIKNIPAIGGEVDVLKAIQLLPGVQSGSEGSAGIYVRGGGPDENLITLDGVPLYNVNHAMGMFSVFNADAIKNVTLYKGNFPARFGSRLSSVIDVRQNDGNSAFWHGGITVGLLAAKMNVEGPIFTKAQLDSLKQGFEPRAKTTFNLSARRTYFDLFMAPILAAVTHEDGFSMTGGYYFYDVNAKVSHTFSDRDRLSATYYMGDDVMYMRYSDKIEGDIDKMSARFRWGNILAAVDWEHQITPRLYSHVQTSYTRYQYKLGQSLNEKYKEEGINYVFDQTMTYASNIHDVTLNAQFDYAPTAKHDIKFGGNYTYHLFQPSVGNFYMLETDSKTEMMRVDTTIGGGLIHGHEAALYFEDTYSPWQWLRLNMGLRGALYGVNGKAYPSVEPRLGLQGLSIQGFVLLCVAVCTSVVQYFDFYAYRPMGAYHQRYTPDALHASGGGTELQPAQPIGNIRGGLLQVFQKSDGIQGGSIVHGECSKLGRTSYTWQWLELWRGSPATAKYRTRNGMDWLYMEPDNAQIRRDKLRQTIPRQV